MHARRGRGRKDGAIACRSSLSQCGIATQNNLKKERATIQKRSLNDSSLSSEGEEEHCNLMGEKMIIVVVVFYLEGGGGITSADDVHHKLTAVFGRCL